MRVLVAAAVVVFAMEGVALACGAPAPGPPGPSCVSLEAYVPGQAFPVDLATNGIRVKVVTVVDNTQATLEDAFPLSKPINLFRQTDSGSGYESAAYELDTGAGLVKGARTLHITDAKPGHYVIGWEGETCKTQASPAGGGKLAGEFTLTPSVPFPATAGTATATPSVTKGRDFQEGVGGDCRPAFIHVDEAKVVFTLTPAAELLPWADALATALEIDGKVMIGYSKPAPELVRAGQHQIEITRICGSDTARYVESPGLAEGTHKARILAEVDGHEAVGTTEISFELHCDASEVRENGYVPSGDGGAAKAPEHDEGCNASGGGQSAPPSALAFLGLALAASTIRRARRARRRS